VQPLPLGATIGILGDGQLGRMLSQAAARLGFKVAIFGPDEDSPAAQVSAHCIVADYNDEAALKRFAELCDVISFEFENVPAACLETLIGFGARVAPGPQALKVTQDRILEKGFARAHGIGTVDYAEVSSYDDLEKAIRIIGLPALLKTRREGYDGKGQVWIRHADEARAAFDALGGKPSILEARADFVREVSVIAARGHDGAWVTYPVGENHHVQGILSTTLAPAPGAEVLMPQINQIASTVLEGLEYVGVLGIEFFVLKEGLLLLNEIAPRVHNTGHWTQDGCLCDQFEQHIRCVAGWPLGDTQAFATVEMTNLLGADILAAHRLAAEPHSRLHVYGKSIGPEGPRAGRKLGHINRLRSGYAL
jgi:5-(carboxyamino)imidazole ribonucleotide synthase